MPKTYNDAKGEWTGPCTVCDQSVSKLETFPGGRCLACWEKITYRGFTSADIKEALKTGRN